MYVCMLVCRCVAAPCRCLPPTSNAAPSKTPSPCPPSLPPLSLPVPLTSPILSPFFLCCRCGAYRLSDGDPAHSFRAQEALHHLLLHAPLPSTTNATHNETGPRMDYGQQQRLWAQFNHAPQVRHTTHTAVVSCEYIIPIHISIGTCFKHALRRVSGMACLCYELSGLLSLPSVSG